MKEEGGNSTEVEIMGRKLVVGSNKDKEYIKNIADYVEREIKNVERSLSGKAPTPDIAVILAAMNIADRHLKSTEEQKKELSILLEKSERLVNFIGERIS
ncbi:MAG TPA: cell division protein ZapA [bacterium]|nr:cell division protein ZapA [bacterium]